MKQLVVMILLVVCSVDFVPAQAQATESASVVHYRSMKVDDVEIFYREAGPRTAPVLLLLHGFPTSSQMSAG